MQTFKKVKPILCLHFRFLDTVCCNGLLSITIEWREMDKGLCMCIRSEHLTCSGPCQHSFLLFTGRALGIAGKLLCGARIITGSFLPKTKWTALWPWLYDRLELHGFLFIIDIWRILLFVVGCLERRGNDDTHHLYEKCIFNQKWWQQTHRKGRALWKKVLGAACFLWAAACVLIGPLLMGNNLKINWL